MNRTDAEITEDIVRGLKRLEADGKVPIKTYDICKEANLKLKDLDTWGHTIQDIMDALNID